MLCGQLRLENLLRMPPPVCAIELPLPSGDEQGDDIFVILDDVDILKKAVAGIAKVVADHDNDDLAVFDALAHLLHQLFAVPHPALDVQPVGHFGRLEDTVAQLRGNLLRAVVLSLYACVYI